jgi:choline dehydrogenase
MGMSTAIDNPELMWRYMTEAEESSHGQPRPWSRGRVLDGSSTVNGMTYCRGNPDDYDQWERQGLKGCGWNEISRAFTAIEDHELGCDSVRGEDGPVHISINSYRSPVNAAILKAAKDLGLKRPGFSGCGFI